MDRRLIEATILYHLLSQTILYAQDTGSRAVDAPKSFHDPLILVKRKYSI